jgi:hypothetical protein
MQTLTHTSRRLQERRIRWTHGLSKQHAALIARLHFGEVS